MTSNENIPQEAGKDGTPEESSKETFPIEPALEGPSKEKELNKVEAPVAEYLSEIITPLEPPIDAFPKDKVTSVQPPMDVFLNEMVTPLAPYRPEMTPEQRRVAAINAKASEFNLGNPLPDGSESYGFAHRFEYGWVFWYSAGLPVEWGVGRPQVVWGTIYDTWARIGREHSLLGNPETDELTCEFLDPHDRFQVFEGGSIYWDHATNQAHVIEGAKFRPRPELPFIESHRGVEAELMGRYRWGLGSCLPKVQIWLDAARGVHAPNAEGIVSIWSCGVNGQYGTQASTNRSWLWPFVKSASGRPAIQFGEHSSHRTGLPFGIELWDTPYTIFAVVQRDSSRGDNYFLKCDGLNCGPFGCEENSAVHLGWQGDRTIRFGQYYNDLDLADAPAFDATRPVISLFTAISDSSEKIISIDEPGFSRTVQKTDGRLLRAGGRYFHVGASDQSTLVRPPQMPDFWFSGYIFEIIICATRLPDFMLEAMKGYLRIKYQI